MSQVVVVAGSDCLSSSLSACWGWGLWLSSFSFESSNSTVLLHLRLAVSVAFLLRSAWDGASRQSWTRLPSTGLFELLTYEVLRRMTVVISIYYPESGWFTLDQFLKLCANKQKGEAHVLLIWPSRRLLPYIVCAFNAIDRDCDEVVSNQAMYFGLGFLGCLGRYCCCTLLLFRFHSSPGEEFDAWMKDPKLEQRIEDETGME